MTHRVALYLRVSTGSQTVENQERELTAAAARDAAARRDAVSFKEWKAQRAEPQTDTERAAEKEAQKAELQAASRQRTVAR